MPDQPASQDPSHVPPGRVYASAFDQLNYACLAITDQLLHVAVSFDGRMDEDRLRAAVLAAVLRCPVLAARFCEADKPYWEPVPALDPSVLLRVHTTGDPDREIRRALVTPVDSSSGPQIRLDLVRGKTDTLCITLHHAAGDARAILDCTRLIASLYREPGLHGTGPIAAEPGLDRSNRPYLSLLPPGARVPENVEGPVVPGTWVVPFWSLDCDTRDFVLRTIPPEELARVRAFGKARSVTTGAVLLAAMALAVRGFRSPSSPGMLCLLSSLDLRRHYPFPGTGLSPGGNQDRYDIANRSVPFRILLPCDDSQTPGSLAPLAAAALKQHHKQDSALLEVLRAEELADAGFASVRDYVGEARDRHLREGGSSPFLVNAGILPEQCLDFGPGLAVTHAFLAAGIATSPPGIVITASTFRDRMTLSFGYCRGAISRRTAAGLLDAIAGSLYP